jgi:hypothetical protein
MYTNQLSPRFVNQTRISCTPISFLQGRISCTPINFLQGRISCTPISFLQGRISCTPINFLQGQTLEKVDWCTWYPTVWFTNLGESWLVYMISYLVHQSTFSKVGYHVHQSTFSKVWYHVHQSTFSKVCKPNCRIPCTPINILQGRISCTPINFLQGLILVWFTNLGESWLVYMVSYSLVYKPWGKLIGVHGNQLSPR